jgi:hypothetical protein
MALSSWTLTVLTLGLLVGACGRSGPPCERLADYLCERETPEYCEQAPAFLNSRLVDDKGAPLDADARAQMCTAIDSTPELRNGYRFKAEQKIKGTPHLDLSKPARDRRLLKFGKGPLSEEAKAKAKAKAEAADAKAR